MVINPPENLEIIYLLYEKAEKVTVIKNKSNQKTLIRFIYIKDKTRDLI